MDPISTSTMQTVTAPVHEAFGADAERGRETRTAPVSVLNSTSAEPARDAVRESADSIARSLDRYLKKNQTDLNVEIDRETKTPVFKIIRRADGQVIKEIPPKEMLDFAVKMKSMVGAMIDSQA